MGTWRLIVVAAVLAASASCASTGDPGNWPVVRVVAYPLNRALDLLDVVSLAGGVYTWYPTGPADQPFSETETAVARWFCPGFGWEVHATRAVQFGLATAWGAEIGWWPGRELGVGTKCTNYLAFGPCSGEQTLYTRWGTRGARQVEIITLEDEPFVNSPFDRVHQEHRDYWAVGGSFYFIGGGEVELHPVEVADFVCGILLVDFMWDDIGHRRTP